ncbi:MAG: hypothetical protein IPP64_12875 [Bacteroidetes bacterium]|nr:hypothetical protein [Bacteroidota bacterium]
MKKLKLIAIIGFLATAGAASAQKITEGDKDLAFLKGETKFNIEYEYTDMMVGKKTEKEYLDEKIKKGNEKQPGKGDRWAEQWKNNRASMYEPMFEELINKQLFKGKTNATAAKNQKDAKYTIHVKVLVTEPGFNSVVLKVNPYCKFEISWVETATGKVMAKGETTAQGVNMGGSDWDFDPSNSIKECYAKAGKTVGGTMAKKMKK